MSPASRAKPELRRLLELLSPVDRRVMAQLWQAPRPDPTALLAVMLDPVKVEAIWRDMREPDKAALVRLLQDGGAVPVGIMQREFGAVREPSRFEHPRAYIEALHGPSTPTERLFNLGLIFRTHDERGAIYRIPNDLLPLLPQLPPRDLTLRLAPVPAPATPLRRDISGVEQTEALAVGVLTLAYAGQLKALEDGALNKASLLKLQKQFPNAPDQLRREAEWPLVALLRAMLVEAGLLRKTSDGAFRPASAAIEWLRASRTERIRRLLDAWCASTSDDLTLLCGLRWKGGAPYTLNRTATRRNLLRLLATVPQAQWLDLAAVIAEIRRVEPDFQRRDGRYDTWLLYDAADRLVSSWEDWHHVEGRLVAAVVQGPLTWLGLVETQPDDERRMLVQLTALGSHLIANAPPPPPPPVAPLIVQSTFEVVCPANASPYAVFQLARLAELKQSGPLSIYLLSRTALLAAIERGISAADVLRFLEEQTAGHVPPNVAYTLREWAGQAEQLRLEDAVLLSATDPVVLAQARTAKALGLGDVEPLTPTLLRVPDGDADELAERLRRAGFGLRDERIEMQSPFDERDLKALVMAAFVYARACAELDLPCEVTPATLQRLSKLVPTRLVDAAQHAATVFAAQLHDNSPPTSND